MFLDIVALDTTVAYFQNLRCLVELSLASQPPGRLGEEEKDDYYDADHCPLRIKVSPTRHVIVCSSTCFLTHLRKNRSLEVHGIYGLELV